MNGTNGIRHDKMKTVLLRYQLESGSKKHFCPSCSKRRLVRYIDSNSGEYLPEQYGRCDRESNCGYHLSPYKDGYSNNRIAEHLPERSSFVKKRSPEQVHIPYPILTRTLRTKPYKKNGFIQNLLHNVSFPLPIKDVERVIEQYYLGTIDQGYMEGALTIPFVNRSGNVRAIQAKLFDHQNHSTHTNWVHSITKSHFDKQNRPYPSWLNEYLKNDKLIDCLFGEHLLSDYANNPIALVEAPKTAIYATLYFGFPSVPENLLWLAVFNLSSLNKEKCRVLKNRDVVLFPDLSKDGTAFQKWSERAKEFNKTIPGASFKVSDLLERNANTQDRENGLDLADYLIKLDWREFRVESSESEKGEKYERV